MASSITNGIASTNNTKQQLAESFQSVKARLLSKEGIPPDQTALSFAGAEDNNNQIRKRRRAQIISCATIEDETQKKRKIADAALRRAEQIKPKSKSQKQRQIITAVKKRWEARQTKQSHPKYRSKMDHVFADRPADEHEEAKKKMIQSRSEDQKDPLNKTIDRIQKQQQQQRRHDYNDGGNDGRYLYAGGDEEDDALQMARIEVEDAEEKEDEAEDISHESDYTGRRFKINNSSGPKARLLKKITTSQQTAAATAAVEPLHSLDLTDEDGEWQTQPRSADEDHFNFGKSKRTLLNHKLNNKSLDRLKITNY
jgi:hypothetical protein